MNGCPQNDGSDLGLSQMCASQWPILKLQQGVDRYVVVTIAGPDGNPLDLDLDVGETHTPEELAFPQTAEAPPAMLVTFTDATGIDTARIVIKSDFTSPTSVVVDGSYIGVGQFRFHFTSDDTNRSGLFVADVQLVDSSGKVRYVKTVYVEISPTTLTDTCSGSPLTLAEVRLSLRDCRGSNILLDDYEFSDAEILFCLRKAVDHWNEVPPPGFGYSYQNFPFRKHWLDATIAMLLRSISHYYRRNKLKYSAAGVSTGRFDKSEEYWAVGTQMWQEYEEWVRAKKVSMNLSSCWGVVGGGWSY